MIESDLLSQFVTKIGLNKINNNIIIIRLSLLVHTNCGWLHAVVSVKTVDVSHLNTKFSVLGKILHKSIQNTNT